MLKRPRTSPDSPTLDYQTVDSEHVTERSIPFGISKEVLCMISLDIGY